MAREALAPFIAPLDAELQANLRLLTSEFATNSVLHARHADATLQLCAWLYPPAARVAIGDSGGEFEAKVGTPGPDDESGRGLLLIDSLADCWGVGRDEYTWSWFELHGPQGPLKHLLDTILAWPLRTKTLAWNLLTTVGMPASITPQSVKWTNDAGELTLVCLEPGVAPSRRRTGRRGPVPERHGARWWLETRHGLRGPRSAPEPVRLPDAGAGATSALSSS